LIDEFTIIDGGRDVVTLEADAARARYHKIHVRFAADPVAVDLSGLRVQRRGGRDIEIIGNGDSAATVERLRSYSPEAIRTEALTLEEIFVSSLHRQDVTA
jgi:hypothetical protein